MFSCFALYIKAECIISLTISYQFYTFEYGFLYRNFTAVLVVWFFDNFNKNVFACTLTNENFSWLTPLGICFTILQLLFGCCAGYCIVFIHCIITFALTLHYGLGDYTGAHSDSTIWGITIYYIISILWSMGMVFKSTRSKKIGDEMLCFPWS